LKNDSLWIDETVDFMVCNLTMPSSNDLRELKKEIIEARGLIIKSNNLTNSLSAEVRSIGKRQSNSERLLTINSYVAYIIFTVLIFTAVQLIYNQRKGALEETLQVAKERAVAAEQKLAKLKQEQSPKGKTKNADLMALYELINDHNRQGAIDAYETLDITLLTPLEGKLLKDTIDRFAADLSMQHYARALELVDKSKYGEAVEEFRTSLRYKDDSGHATGAKIQMANALRLQGKPREAIAVLQRLLEENLDRSLADDAYWYLALSHEEAHQKDEARSVLRALMRQFPDSQYYRAARIRQAEIQLRLYKRD
jgi:TolA-binding protein